MTAAELIELLRKHPKACAILGITEAHMAFPWTPDTRDTALRWITVGKCVEWCDANNIHITQDSDAPGMFVRPTGAYAYDVYPSRLHAMLAAMEAATIRFAEGGGR